MVPQEGRAVKKGLGPMPLQGRKPPESISMPPPCLCTLQRLASTAPSEDPYAPVGDPIHPRAVDYGAAGPAMVLAAIPCFLRVFLRLPSFLAAPV